MTYTLDQANEFINKSQVNLKFYPQLNFAAPVGWINDPNGVSIYKDEYHLFYQYFPYGPMHGSMHWGHAKSLDGLNWEHLPVALAPDQSYDWGGVFSGSAIEHNQQLVLFYTGNLPSLLEEDSRQNQNIAISKDGINFDKLASNPVLDLDDLPKGTSHAHFRDPKIIEHQGKYYAVIGSKSDDNIGQILLYQSEDMIEWKFVNVILKDFDYLGDMAECPDLLMFDGKDVIIVSAMNYIEDGTVFPHRTLIIEGQMDWDNYIFVTETKREMDLGLDYYAPQTAREQDGSYFAIAWQQSWGKTLVPAVLGHGWMGQMTIPQTIYFENNRVYRAIHPKVLVNQKVLNSFESLVGQQIIQLEQAQYITLLFNRLRCSKITLSLNNQSEKLILDLDFETQVGYFSRKNVEYIIEQHDGTGYSSRNFTFNLDDDDIKIQILKDTSSLQVYINSYVSISSTYYSEKPLDFLTITIEEDSKLDLVELFKIKEDS